MLYLPNRQFTISCGLAHEHTNCKNMDRQSIDSVRRLLIRLEDARREVQELKGKVDYPMTSTFERAYDSIETAEKYLRNTIE